MPILELAQDHKYTRGVIGDFAREIIRLTAERDALYKAIQEHIDEGNRLAAEVARLRRVIVDLTQKHDWENYLMSDETEAVMRELYPFSKLADREDAAQERDRKEWQQTTDELRHGG